MLDLPETSSCVCVIVSRPRKVGRPRASSVENPSDATEAVLCQSLSRSWRPVICDGFCRRIQKTPLKCSDSISRSTSILETAFFEKVSNLKTFLDFLAFIDGGRAPRKNAVNRACGHLGGPLGFSKKISWGRFKHPRSLPGGEKKFRAPSSPRPSAEQIDCIFTGWEGALGAPTL